MIIKINKNYTIDCYDIDGHTVIMNVDNIDSVGNVIITPYFLTLIAPHTINFGPLNAADIGKYYFKVTINDGYHYDYRNFELEIVNTPPKFVEDGPKDL
jgi:hypothetical protein